MDNALTELNEEFSPFVTGVRRLLAFSDASLFNPLIHIVSWGFAAAALLIDNSKDLVVERIA